MRGYPGHNFSAVDQAPLGRERCLVHLLREPDPSRAPDAALQVHILRNAGYPVVLGALPDPVAVGSAVVIDALYGTGLSRPLDDVAMQWVAFANAQRGKKLAVDIPSGLHGDTGEILGAGPGHELRHAGLGVEKLREGSQGFLEQIVVVGMLRVAGDNPGKRGI